ncbi:hypothetical protein IV500_05385 [Paeniglutamicibacter antarcticus]|uniref:Uncharacterized protein n=1 Tax=Arthrobacter terrae TaxID=2935737 RepID=A0A931G4J0_9MICC|nr:hypothetical protein [Arthrobacter terrae]MBG0738853.1 hypothetical protein [Arthrobacter terrae]
MTTATTTSPLETYQHGRDKFLAVVLDAVSGLESSVLDFQYQHGGLLRTTGAELEEALRTKADLEVLVGEQANELEASRSHVCPVNETEDAATDAVEDPDTEIIPDTEDTTRSAGDARTIAELQSALEAERRISAGLRADLAAEQAVSAGLRGELASKADVYSRLGDVENSLREATEAHTRYVSETQESFEQRLGAGVRAAESGIRIEAVRIIEAIAADNPALAEAADLFTVAFPAETEPLCDNGGAARGAVPDPVTPVPVGDFLAALPAPELTTPPQDLQAPAEPDWDSMIPAPAPTAENFFTTLPVPEPETAPEPFTQVLLPAPDLSDDAILDPHFFDTPVPLEEPAGEPVQSPAPTDGRVEAPTPGYGQFGLRKEN